MRAYYSCLIIRVLSLFECPIQPNMDELFINFKQYQFNYYSHADLNKFIKINMWQVNNTTQADPNSMRGSNQSSPAASNRSNAKNQSDFNLGPSEQITQNAQQDSPKSKPFLELKDKKENEGTNGRSPRQEHQRSPRFGGDADSTNQLKTNIICEEVTLETQTKQANHYETQNKQADDANVDFRPIQNSAIAETAQDPLNEVVNSTGYAFKAVKEENLAEPSHFIQSPNQLSDQKDFRKSNLQLENMAENEGKCNYKRDLQARLEEGLVSRNDRGPKSAIKSAFATQNKPKKKKLAKDDSCSKIGFGNHLLGHLTSSDRFADNELMDALKSNNQKNRIQSKEDDMISSPTNRNALHQRSQRVDVAKKTRKREMSETFLRSRQENLKTNLIAEEDDNEFDLAQSLMTLQLYNKAPKPQGINSRYNQNIMQSPLINRQKTSYQLWKNQNTANNERSIFQKDSTIKKQSFVAIGSTGYDGGSDIAEDDTAFVGGPKDINQQQSDKDGSDQDTQQESVSLDDSGLNDLDAMNFQSNLSTNGLDGCMQNAIVKAEEHVERNDEAQPEYESLVLGQSIWSTDVPKETKKQFMESIQQLTSSDINRAQNSGQVNTKKSNESDQENEFDIIQRTIQEHTQQQMVNEEQMKLQLVPPDGADQLCGASQQQNNFEVPTIQNVNQIERSLSQINYNQGQLLSSLNQVNQVNPLSQNPKAIEQTIQTQGQQLNLNFNYQSDAAPQNQVNGAFQMDKIQTQIINPPHSSVNQFNLHETNLKKSTPSLINPTGDGSTLSDREAVGQHQPIQHTDYYNNADGQNPYQNFPNYTNNQGSDLNQHNQCQMSQENNYGNDYAPHQTHQEIQQTNPGVASSLSVHSTGGHVAFPAASSVGIYEVGPEYPDNASSNYTHHPYSQYGQQNQQSSHQQIQQSNQNHNLYFGSNGNGGTSSNNAPYSMNQSRAHIFVNRQINKFMMNPIYKNKQTITSLQMHRYTGIPWRGGSNQANINAQIQSMQSIQQQQSGLTNGNMGSQHISPTGGVFSQETDNAGQSGRLYTESNQHTHESSPTVANSQFQQFYISQKGQIQNTETVDGQNYVETNQGQSPIQIESKTADQMAALDQQHFQKSNKTQHQDQTEAPSIYPNQAQNDKHSQNQQLSEQQVQKQNSHNFQEFNNQVNQIQQLQQNNQMGIQFFNTASTLNAQPFYPKNYGEQQEKKMKLINDSANVLAAGKKRNIHVPWQKAPAIHVPIPIPIMSRGAPTKPKVPTEVDIQGLNSSKHQIQNDRSIFMNSFFGEQILSKKIELDQRLKETTQNLESKLNKAAEINDEDDNDDEEEDITFEVTSAQEPSEISIERPDSALNNSINLKDLKNHLSNNQINVKNMRHQVDKKGSEIREQVNHEKNKINLYEARIKRKEDRAAIFKKLQDQLNQFKSEMFTNTDSTTPNISHNNASSISPKRSQDLFKNKEKDTVKEHSLDFKNQSRLRPFRQDAKQYMDKVLNLMNMINEVDGLTNVAELKNKLEKQRLLFIKARAERDEFQSQLTKIHHHQHSIEQDFKEQQNSFQSKLTESQNLAQTLNQNNQTLREQNEFNEHQSFELRQQLQQLDQLRQENHDLIMRNNQLQENIQENAKIYGQQIQNSNNQNDQLQKSVFNQHNQINQLNSQIEQINQNNFNVQQNLGQLQIENQKLQSNLDKMENYKNQKEEEVLELQKKIKQTNKASFNKDSDDDDYSTGRGGRGSDHSSSDGDEIPLGEKLENANLQIRDLQEYIKKKGLEDVKNNQIRQENFQKNERAHLERYNKLKKRMEDMERDKDQIIHHLKDFIKNHNESILVGSLGSSMIGASGAASIHSNNSNKQEEQQNRINDQSTIDARSQDSRGEQSLLEDKEENEDIVRAIMSDYTCENCEKKDKIIQNNEQRIQDYINYIKKQSMQRATGGSRGDMPGVGAEDEQSVDAQTQTDTINSSDGQRRAENQISSVVMQNQSCASSQSSTTATSHLKASHQILLNNLIRQFKEYLDNYDPQSAASNMSDIVNRNMDKMKTKLNQIADAQRITLFDDEEEPDQSLINDELIQEIMSLSLDLIAELLLEKQLIRANSSAGTPEAEPSQPKIIQKIIEKIVVEFKTVDFGICFQELKEMQSLARQERKACHHIIVEIEKLMYELNSLLTNEPEAQEQPMENGSSQVFGQVLDTYLKLPHRLKPIFDHCKKIENVLIRALKAQDEAIKSAQKGQQQESSGATGENDASGKKFN